LSGRYFCSLPSTQSGVSFGVWNIGSCSPSHTLATVFTVLLLFLALRSLFLCGWGGRFNLFFLFFCRYGQSNPFHAVLSLEVQKSLKM
jgi:hypothetical protein